MSQWSRSNPEAYEQGIDWLDAHSDLADLQKPSEIREALGVPEAFPMNVDRIEVIEEPTPNCPYCGAPWDEGHRPGCRLYVGDE